MKKYALLVAAVVCAASFAFAVPGPYDPYHAYGPTERYSQHYGGIIAQSSVIDQPASVEKNFEGTIVSLSRIGKGKMKNERITLLGAENNERTFVVNKKTMIEGKGKLDLVLSSLKKDEKVLVTYREVKDRDVADFVDIES